MTRRSVTGPSPENQISIFRFRFVPSSIVVVIATVRSFSSFSCEFTILFSFHFLHPSLRPAKSFFMQRWTQNDEHFRRRHCSNCTSNQQCLSQEWMCLRLSESLRYRIVWMDHFSCLAVVGVDCRIAKWKPRNGQNWMHEMAGTFVSHGSVFDIDTIGRNGENASIRLHACVWK